MESKLWLRLLASNVTSHVEQLRALHKEYNELINILATITATPKSKLPIFFI